MSDTVKSSVLGLDRQKMEEERLARLKKKRTAAEVDMPETTRPAKVAATTPEITAATMKPFTTNKGPPQDPNPPANPKDPPITQTQLQYPLGTVKRTKALNDRNSISIEEVLQAPTVTTALVTSWQFDFDWLLSKIRPAKTKFIFVVEAKKPEEKQKWQLDFKGLEKSVRLCFPPMSGNIYARMHSKLMLLFHPTHLRIVIPSANPVSHDWGESNLLENMLFLIDLPRMSDASQAQPKQPQTTFQKELLRFLDAQGIYDDVKTGVMKFDFNATKDLSFIHSIPGTYEDNAALTTGTCGLSEAVRSLGCASHIHEPIEVDFASASLGSLDEIQISTFQRALRGESFASPTQTEKNHNEETIFRIIFPTHETVKNSRGGTDAGGTIFLKSNAYQNPSFPTQLLHDYSSTRKGLLSHNKLILVRSPSIAYFYTGSANFSASAWGRVSYISTKNNKASTSQSNTAKLKLTVTNWECGVLIPVSRAAADGNGAEPTTNMAPKDVIVIPDGPSSTSTFTSKTGGHAASKPSTSATKTKNVIVIDDSSTDSEVEEVSADVKGQSKTMAQQNSGQTVKVLPYSVFDGKLDIPFQTPPRKYAENEKPWLQ